MQRTIGIIIFLIGFLFMGIYLENSDYFRSAKTELQKVTLPSPPLKFGKRGTILEQLGLPYKFPKDFSRFFDAETGRYRLRDIISLYSEREEYRKEWIRPDELKPEALPSSKVLAQRLVDSGASILSVVVDNEDLYDPSTGIIENRKEKGKAWERPCFISYYEGGRLKLATGAGVRIHGGSLNPRAAESLRFYFREIYGRENVDAGVFFSDGGKPIHQLIARIESEFASALALDLSREIGCLAPQSHPVIVYLNGERYGKHFVLTEHLNDDWLKNHFGHDDFVLIRTTGHVEERNRIPEWREFKKWARDNSIIKTMDTVSDRVDVENMSRWFLSQFFTAGNDMYQGPLVKSRIDPDAKWFWINWDMDHSFRNPYEPEKKKLWEQELNFHNVIRNPPKDRKDPRTRFFRPDDPRSVLFRQMYKNDPRFRKYFEALFMEVMNHRLNPEFLQEWVAAQRAAYGMCGFHMDDVFDKLAEYMARRPGYLRELMRKYFESPQSHAVTIKIPENLTLIIDGFKKRKFYSGWYFAGSTIRVRVPAEERGRISNWRVNDEIKSAPDGMLTLNVHGGITVEPVLSPNYAVFEAPFRIESPSGP